MTKKSLKGKLGHTLRAEEEAVNKRFANAETTLARKSAGLSPRPSTATTKVIRDSFTMPLSDHQILTTMKKRCMRVGIDTNKSEILRAGLAALQNVSDQELAQLFESLTKVKTGRPQQTA